LTELHQQFKAMRADPGSIFRDASFDPYGLDSDWTGLRSFGGQGSNDGVITSLTLSHGDPYDETSPLVRLQTVLARIISGDPRADLIHERWSVVRQLVGFMWRATHILDPDVRRAAFTPGEVAPDPTGPWDGVTVRIDNDQSELRVLRQETTWVGLAERSGLLVAIEAERWPVERTGLETIVGDRFAEYEAGSITLSQRFYPPPDASAE
jgi:hypothetical protein